MEVARASRRNMEVVLIGHAGHPEVEGTMGQYASETGGMYLVEKPEDVYKLEVKDPSNLHFVSQTTLSVDETADVIDTLRKVFPDIQARAKTISVTRPKTVRMPCAIWRPSVMFWWW